MSYVSLNPHYSVKFHIRPKSKYNPKDALNNVQNRTKPYKTLMKPQPNLNETRSGPRKNLAETLVEPNKTSIGSPKTTLPRPYSNLKKNKDPMTPLNQQDFYRSSACCSALGGRSDRLPACKSEPPTGTGFRVRV